MPVEYLAEYVVEYLVAYFVKYLVEHLVIFGEYLDDEDEDDKLCQ